MGDTPKASIIMPVYNSGDYLKTAVESILNQSFKDFELILVDDGSTDGSSERCNEYAKKDSRVVVIHQKNGGICNARNSALRIARGEYIGFSDHDDEFLPSAFDAVNKKITETHADVVKFRKVWHIIKKGKKIRKASNNFCDCVLERQDIRDQFFELKNNDVLNCVWDGWFRRELFEHNKFNEYYKSGGEDIDIMYDIICEIKKFAFINTVFYVHYIRRGFSTSSKFNITKIKAVENLAIKMNEALVKLGINRDDNPFEYSFFLMKYCYFPIINILASDACKYTHKEKVQVLKNMMIQDYSPVYVFKQSVQSFYKTSKKIGFGYFLLKNSLYHLLFLMFNYRGKHS